MKFHVKLGFCLSSVGIVQRNGGKSLKWQTVPPGKSIISLQGLIEIVDYGVLQWFSFPLKGGPDYGPCVYLNHFLHPNSSSENKFSHNWENPKFISLRTNII